MARTVQGKGNNLTEQPHVVNDKVITCKTFTIDKVSGQCVQCTNARFCRKARRIIKMRNNIDKRNAYRDWVKGICAPKLPVKSVSDEIQIKRAVATVENKAPVQPHYQRAENILRLPTFSNRKRKQTRRQKKRYDLARRKDVPHIHY